MCHYLGMFDEASWSSGGSQCCSVCGVGAALQLLGLAAFKHTATLSLLLGVQ